MSRRSMKSGEVLMSKGEKAYHLYYLASGTMRIPELGKVIDPGEILGEIGVFARDHRRTATVVCVDDCEVYEMGENKVWQLYFQNRAFGIAILQLIIGRLVEGTTLRQAGPTGDMQLERRRRASERS